jgi:hypothetical protein
MSSMSQPLSKLFKIAALARIHVTNVMIEGTWMPCEYEQNKNGKVRIVTLADIDVDAPRNRAPWHPTVAVAAHHVFERLSPCRKISVRELIRGRAIEDCPFKQFLKRDLFANPISKSHDVKLKIPN